MAATVIPRLKLPNSLSPDAIQRWAADATATDPAADWDLILAQQPHTDLYLRLATSPDCPKAEYFLALLYRIVGNAVRSDYATKPRYELELLLNTATRDFPNPEIRLWSQRSAALINDPTRFNYTDWCCGALARANS